MRVVSIFARAKLNLFLAVTGRRPDSFHDLVSLATQLDFGDTLTCELAEPNGSGASTLECDDPAVPRDDTNLVLKAARIFADATGWRQPGRV